MAQRPDETLTSHDLIKTEPNGNEFQSRATEKTIATRRGHANRLLRRRSVVNHTLGGLVLLLDAGAANEGLPVGGLVVDLDQGAAAAAAGEGNIGEAATLEVVLVAGLGTLHDQRDDGETDAASRAQQEALIRSLVSKNSPYIGFGEGTRHTEVLTGS